MRLTPAKLLTIIAESLLERELTALIENAGASGYTVEEDIQGKGKHGVRGGRLESMKNIKVLVIASPSVAKRIVADVQKNLAPTYAIIAFMHDVEVMNVLPARADSVSV